MKMTILICTEDSELIVKEIQDLNQYEFLSDVCGEYGLGSDLSPYEQKSLEDNCCHFLDAYDGNDDEDLEKKMDQFRKLIQGKNGFSLLYCSIDGQDTILGFIEGTVDEVMKMWDEKEKDED